MIQRSFLIKSGCTSTSQFCAIALESGAKNRLKSTLFGPDQQIRKRPSLKRWDTESTHSVLLLVPGRVDASTQRRLAGLCSLIHDQCSDIQRFRSVPDSYSKLATCLYSDFCSSFLKKQGFRPAVARATTQLHHIERRHQKLATSAAISWQPVLRLA